MALWLRQRDQASQDYLDLIHNHASEFHHVDFVEEVILDLESFLEPYLLSQGLLIDGK